MLAESMSLGHHLCRPARSSHSRLSPACCLQEEDLSESPDSAPGVLPPVEQLRAKDIKTGLLESICKVLNVKMDFFYGGTEYLEGYELIKQSDLKEFKSKLDQIHTCCNEISGKLS